MAIHLDSGHEVAFNIRGNPHLDHGYAVTSHSSQGQTADRVLLHVDTERGGEVLINSRLAYVAVSRGQYDAQIYTNDKAALGEGLEREYSKQSAIGLSTSSDQAHHQQYSQGRAWATEKTGKSKGDCKGKLAMKDPIGKKTPSGSPKGE